MPLRRRRLPQGRRARGSPFVRWCPLARAPTYTEYRLRVPRLGHNESLRRAGKCVWDAETHGSPLSFQARPQQLPRCPASLLGLPRASSLPSSPAPPPPRQGRERKRTPGRDEWRAGPCTARAVRGNGGPYRSGGSRGAGRQARCWSARSTHPEKALWGREEPRSGKDRRRPNLSREGGPSTQRVSSLPLSQSCVGDPGRVRDPQRRPNHPRPAPSSVFDSLGGRPGLSQEKTV